LDLAFGIGSPPQFLVEPAEQIVSVGAIRVQFQGGFEGADGSKATASGKRRNGLSSSRIDLGGIADHRNRSWRGIQAALCPWGFRHKNHYGTHNQCGEHFSGPWAFLLAFEVRLVRLWSTVDAQRAGD